MDWRSSDGIGKTVHLAVDWDHSKSPPHGRLAVSMVSEGALLPSAVNIREKREKGKPDRMGLRRHRNPRMPVGRPFRDGRAGRSC
jgi:hypothetical protein